MANVILKVGTKLLFNELEQKDVNTLYWLTDTNEIYKGDALFGVGREATASAAGLLSAQDKEKLDALVAGTVAGLVPVDATVVIEDGDSGTKTIGVQISKEPNNAIVLKADGLFVNMPDSAEIPEYSIEKQGEADDGFSATYRLKKTVGSSTTYAGDSINIPKDLVVQSGSIQEVSEEDVPYIGAKVGDTYIDLVLNDPEASHIYIPAKDLIDTSNFVTKEIINTNGSRALVWNEASGGGAKFYHQDGTESFVGVSDGGENGLVAQIYADKQVDGNWVGSRINVYRKGIFYHNAEDKAAPGYVADDPKHEIATIGDITTVQEAVTALSESLVWGSL